MKKATLFNGILALVLMVFILSTAVVLTLYCRPLYALDVTLLDIPGKTGLDKATILANYDAVIRYNTLWGPDTLTYPTFPMSETGRIHMAEVKEIFLTIQWMAIVAGLLSAGGIAYRQRHKDARYLRLAGILTVAIPAGVGAVVAVSWDTAFVLFHRLFFNNDYWLFDPVTDPLITILPDAYFLHCALLIIALALLGSGACLIAYRKQKSVPVH